MPLKHRYDSQDNTEILGVSAYKQKESQPQLFNLTCHAETSSNANIMILFQVLVYKDDFTSERSDRERAQSKIQELQLEVACLQHQLARRQVNKQNARFSNKNISSGFKTKMYF